MKTPAWPSPAAVLAAIQANPGLYRGRNVVLFERHIQWARPEQQIAALHAAGAAGITVLGVGSRFSGVNERFAQIAFEAALISPVRSVSRIT